MINVDEYLFLVDGPYASYQRALLVTPKQGFFLKEDGFTVLSIKDYKEECIKRGIAHKKSELILHTNWK